MRKILKLSLLESLIEQGYAYCLSKTTLVLGQDAHTCITLTPVKYKPAPGSLLFEYDTYFDIEKEPRQMMNGFPGTLIVLNLDDTEIDT